MSNLINFLPSKMLFELPISHLSSLKLMTTIGKKDYLIKFLHFFSSKFDLNTCKNLIEINKRSFAYIFKN